MTKVRLSRSLLEFRQSMAELVHQVCDENTSTMAHQQDQDIFLPRTDVIELWTPGLLRPPKIEAVWPDIRVKDGHLDGFIQISTSEYFGVVNVYVLLEDAQGNRIESDYALDNDQVENHWAYFPSAPVSPATTIIVRTMAIDRLGAIAMNTKKVTL